MLTRIGRSDPSLTENEDERTEINYQGYAKRPHYKVKFVQAMDVHMGGATYFFFIKIGTPTLYTLVSYKILWVEVFHQVHHII